MSKHNYKKSRLKYVFLATVCASAFAFSGIAAACDNNSSDDTDNDKTTTKEDTQLLKNGNFEIFTIPETKENGNPPVYLIKTPENWTRGGTSSYTMSGIISTSEDAWEKMTDENLEADLDFNNNLDSSSSDYLSQYVDYNGMKSSDILYQDPYWALKKDEDLEEGEERNLARIKNPETHYNVREKDGKLYTDGGNGQEVFVNDDGEYFLEYDEAKKEYKQPISNILMLHNYATSRNGIAQTYSSVEIELPANTAAEISLWVKTSYLKFSQGKEVIQDRGANISVTQTVGSSTIDKFTISSINTEKLLGTGIYKDETAVIEDKYNGWLEYTVYVNACDFASSKIKLELGLGETGYTTEGYAFFDDVKVTKYSSLDKSESYKANEDKLNNNNTCRLSSDASEKIFKADSYVRNNGAVKDDRNSKDFYYYIDLASEHSDSDKDTYNPVSFESAKVGYTVDSDNYVSSKNDISDKSLVGFTANNVIAVDSKWKLPFNTNENGGPLTTSDDLLAYVTTSATPFTASQTKYADRLNTALASAVNLPKNSADNKNNMLVMLSAYGAAYTASFDLNIAKEGYKIISFWVKTSDMQGSTAATVKITEKDNEDNTAQITIDTTDKVTNIGTEENEKDIFNGWVQCFFFVKNELENDAAFTIDFSFGNTTISGTDVHSYKYGYAALANMQYLDVDEDIYSYTGSGDNTATLTIVEDPAKQTHVFDEAYGSLSHTIKDNMVIPSTYKGVNGASSSVVNNPYVSMPYDEINNNHFTDSNGNDRIFTGLINKENFTDDKNPYKNSLWYDKLISKFCPENTSTMRAIDKWNAIFGKKSVQPLIIYNAMRTSYVEERGTTVENFRGRWFKNEDGLFEQVSTLASDSEFDETKTYYTTKDVMNYGYIGSDSEVSANSYATVSVRVRVSAGAVAYIYLVDTSSSANVHSFSTPSYSFYYDVEGNVLKGEPKKNATITEQRENVLYNLREDGLYEDKDGKLYANTWNYKKSYFQNTDYYDADGNKYTIDGLIEGVTYYKDKNKNEADHYLVTGSDEKIYEFKDGNYYYIVEGTTQNDVITPFDRQYARYSKTEKETWSENYTVAIDGKTYTDWVTVNFVLHAGSEAKPYRLELWSGKRDEAITDKDNAQGEFVMFDYSYLNVSDDTLRSEYESEIISQYKDALSRAGKLEGIESSDKNIAYYEKLAKENNITIGTDYSAHYYTYSLYDSADFKPFNKTVADENASGYDYSVSDQSETLAYLRVNEDNAITVFTDYSNIDKSITLNEGNDNTTDGDDTTEDEDNGSDGSIWLLASSIILVVALVFAIIAIFLKDIIKKRRRNKVTSKNNYNQRKTNRYKRKLGLRNEEIVEVDMNTVNSGEPAEETDDNVSNEVPENEEPETTETPEPETVETPVEEAPAPVEEEKAEDNTTEEKPDDNQE